MLQKPNRDKDIVIDLILMQREKNWKNFIQRISIPQEIYLYSEEQLRLPNNEKFNLITNNRNTLYMDATGSIVKKFDDSSKKVYLYSIIIHISNGEKKVFLFLWRKLS